MQNEPKSGESVSHYVIAEKLGQGHMGSVWKARDTKLNRHVALKFLAPDGTPDMLARLRIEAQTLAALNHPNIATIYGLETHQDRPVLVLEYLGGGDLSQAESPLPLDTLLSYAAQLASGLRAAHTEGILHRDLKPANLLLSASGTLKIADFGLAHLGVDPSATATKSGILLGTPQYMSPEQASGLRADARSDIFSFGVILYELATGAKPFPAGNQLELLDKIRNTPHAPLHSHRTGLPPAFESLVHRMLQKRPEDRVQTAHEIETAVKSLQGVGPAPLAPVQAPGAPLFLICTVGGSPEPIVVSILHEHRRPRSLRVLFVGSELTLTSVQHQPAPTRHDKICPVCHQPSHECRDHTGIVERLAAEGFILDAGRFETLNLPDPDDLLSCVETMQRQLTHKVEEWTARGPHFDVVVDFTGGTKCMSVALGLVARRWPCRFTYVGGTLRTRGGEGVVVSGREKVVQNQNPWDALGYQIAEDALTLSNGGDYAAATRLLDGASIRANEPYLKRSLRTMALLTGAFAHWDRFQHREAWRSFSDLRKSEVDLDQFLGRSQAAALVRRIPGYLERLDILAKTTGPAPEIIADLLANAQRRGREDRYDDAVARIYRAIEAIAQFRLKSHHAIDNTGAVPPERVPAGLTHDWAQGPNLPLKPLGLQDCYTLLQALGDDLGKRFFVLGLGSGQHSPLVSRNQSIFAHGFQPVGLKVYQKLWEAALALAAQIGVSGDGLIQFPQFQEARK